MTLSPALVPQGISHSPDLSAMPKADRIKHHIRQLRTIALHQGIDGVKAYKAENPEAASLRIQSSPTIYDPKPPGYPDALASLVAGWFASDTALRSTNRDDVARLNTRLGTDRFDPDRHFSKPLSKSVLNRIEAVFVANGVQFDRAACSTMGKVRRAAMQAKSGGQATATPQAISRQGATVTIGQASFPVEHHGGHYCIRVAVAGKRVRVRLDALAEVISLAGFQSGAGVPDTPIRSIVGDSAQNGLADTIPPGTRPKTEKPPRQSPEDLAQDEPPLSLSDRIRRLPRANPRGPAIPDGQDPLALI
ncbi:hypothetical protein [Qipengyuania qiaonensis]|uniref:Uncharacterized protein n=1 Tax=Qipengyuania qiaonensis TaxID=2867240 RepID=A0ABS7J6L0_9SPHN|nr:hypothetical protein [Qipengyuania qiaonensis]MBX7482965.1 hypothetical protein [Qipengyuania qiaonensis]